MNIVPIVWGDYYNDGHGRTDEAVISHPSKTTAEIRSDVDTVRQEFSFSEIANSFEDDTVPHDVAVSALEKFANAGIAYGGIDRNEEDTAYILDDVGEFLSACLRTIDYRYSVDTSGRSVYILPEFVGMFW